MIKEDCITELTHILNQIPYGKLQLEKHSSHSSKTFFIDYSQKQVDGKGKIDIFPLFPGIELAFHYLLAEKQCDCHSAASHILELNYCRAGRIGWNMKEGMAVYLGAGDLSIHTMDCCASSIISYPLGYFSGITIYIDLDIFTINIPDLLKEAGINGQTLRTPFCSSHKPFTIPLCRETDNIFSSFYNLPEPIKIPFYKLKTQELLLFLSMQANNRQSKPSISCQTDLIKEIHTFLTKHLEQRFTIEDLSKQYHINTSSLKADFKTVYGKPIAAYMKEYRIRQSIKLLLETNHSIASIASQVGYESQSKFSRAFKEFTQILPTEYRNNHISTK